MLSPASNVETEELLLSCCVMDEGVTLAETLSKGISEEMFYYLNNRLIFGVLCKMLSEGKAIDLLMLSNELRMKSLLEEAGGYEHLVKITNKTPTTSQAPAFIQAVRDLYIIRQVGMEAKRLAEACEHFSGDVDEIVTAPLARMTALTTGFLGENEPDWSQVVDQAISVTEAIIRDAGPPADRIIEFPWPEMNNRFGPMERGQLNLLAAQTSVGKSSLARPIAAHAASKGHGIYFVTLEVNPVRVALNLAAAASKIGVKALPHAHLRDRQDFKNALLDLRNAGIVCSRKDRTLARIVGRARALRKQGKLDLLVVDHGGLLDDVLSSTKNDLIQNISRLGKTLKNLAGELDIVALMLWQLNRGSQHDGNREPRKSDLRDSGTLEEDCDKLLLLHRPNTNPLTSQDQPETSHVGDCPKFYTNVIQAKGRDDGTSIMPFLFDRATTSFIPVLTPS
jgi:replicative DNA helicase